MPDCTRGAVKSRSQRRRLLHRAPPAGIRDRVGGPGGDGGEDGAGIGSLGLFSFIRWLFSIFFFFFVTFFHKRTRHEYNNNNDNYCLSSSRGRGGVSVVRARPGKRVRDKDGRRGATGIVGPLVPTSQRALGPRPPNFSKIDL